MFGEFEVLINGEVVEKGPNTVTNLGRKWLIDRAVNVGSVLAWNTTSAYLAVGEGSGLSLASLSGLINEVGAGNNSRAQFLSVNRGVDAGSTICGSVTFGGSGARGIIRELGVFVTGYDGAVVKTATSTKDTGILFARKSMNTTRTVNSGALFEVRYLYTLWNS